MCTHVPQSVMWLGNEALYITNSVCLGQPNYATTRSLQTQLHN